MSENPDTELKLIDGHEDMKAKIHVLKCDKIALQKELDGKDVLFKLKEQELRASEHFREEARKRCIRYEKIMFLMADKIEVFDEQFRD